MNKPIYHAQKLNAIIKHTYPYNLNPPYVPDAAKEDQHCTYTSFNKIESVIQDQMLTDKQMNFEYGVDQQRIKMDISVGYPNSVCTNYNVNSANMEILNGESYTYIYADGKPIAIHKQSDNKLYYLHLDHQGSLLTITDNNGIVEQRSYDAWGRPRNPVDWTYALPNPFGSGSITLRGQLTSNELNNIKSLMPDIYKVIHRFSEIDSFRSKVTYYEYGIMGIRKPVWFIRSSNAKYMYSISISNCTGEKNEFQANCSLCLDGAWLLPLSKGGILNRQLTYRQRRELIKIFKKDLGL
ncbi:MAG: hypothetical protein H7296_06750 [Bacteroidia bacterium]|nr:hypothetical protein [Bacteroidia bacterium]